MELLYCKLDLKIRKQAFLIKGNNYLHHTVYNIVDTTAGEQFKHICIVLAEFSTTECYYPYNVSECESSSRYQVSTNWPDVV